MSRALACADGVGLLMDYLEDVLDAQTRAGIDAHLAAVLSLRRVRAVLPCDARHHPPCDRSRGARDARCLAAGVPGPEPLASYSPPVAAAASGAAIVNGSRTSTMAPPTSSRRSSTNS